MWWRMPTAGRNPGPATTTNTATTSPVHPSTCLCYCVGLLSLFSRLSGCLRVYLSVFLFRCQSFSLSVFVLVDPLSTNVHRLRPHRKKSFNLFKSRCAGDSVQGFRLYPSHHIVLMQVAFIFTWFRTTMDAVSVFVVSRICLGSTPRGPVLKASIDSADNYIRSPTLRCRA